MTRSILLTAAVAALIAAVAPTNASAAEPAAKDGQISADMLAQFGLGGSEAVSDEEGEEIRGKGGRRQRIRRIYESKRVRRLNRLKRGNYTVRYKSTIKRSKPTVSRGGNFGGPARSFTLPGLR